jgi:hypothetical protein
MSETKVIDAPDSVASWHDEPDVERYRRSLKLVSEHAPGAIVELEALADLGSIRSMMYLGFLYDGGKFVSRDPNRAKFWYNRAIQAGAIDGWYYLGRLFVGEGAYAKALEAFREGSDHNHVLSINWLAVMYFRGWGVARDLEKARYLWERASSMGHLVSRRHLGVLSLTGRFGVLQIPRGLSLLWSILADTRGIAQRDPTSELLGQ